MKYLKRSPTSSSTGIAVLSNDLILPKSYENAMEGCVSPLLVRASNRFRSRLAGIWCKLEFQWNAYTDKVTAQHDRCEVSEQTTRSKFYIKPSIAIGNHFRKLINPFRHAVVVGGRASRSRYLERSLIHQF